MTDDFKTWKDIVIIAIQLAAIVYMLRACVLLNRTRKRMERLNEDLDREFKKYDKHDS